jgi:hypothetical protein
VSVHAAKGHWTSAGRLRGLIQIVGLIHWLIISLGKNLLFLVRIRRGQGSWLGRRSNVKKAGIACRLLFPGLGRLGRRIRWLLCLRPRRLGRDWRSLRRHLRPGLHLGGLGCRRHLFLGGFKRVLQFEVGSNKLDQRGRQLCVKVLSRPSHAKGSGERIVFAFVELAGNDVDADSVASKRVRIMTTVLCRSSEPSSLNMVQRNAAFAESATLAVY